MASITAIVLNDGLATPVARTFGVQSGQQSTAPASWLEKTADVYAGYIRLTSLLRRAPKAAKHVVTLKVALPKLAVMGISALGSTPAPTTTSTGFATVEFSIPDNFTAADRANLLAYTANSLGNAAIRAQVLQLEPIF